MMPCMSLLHTTQNNMEIPIARDLCLGSNRYMYICVHVLVDDSVHVQLYNALHKSHMGI